MGCFVVKIAWMSLVSSMLGLMILGIRKINKKMPIQLISMFWLIFLAFLIIPFQFENIHNNLKITQDLSNDYTIISCLYQFIFMAWRPLFMRFVASWQVVSLTIENEWVILYLFPCLLKRNSV